MQKIEITNDIRRLRFDRDEMTQAQLAEAVGVTRQTIASIEKGKYFPTLEVAIRIADVFDAPIGDVFKHRFLED